MNRKDVCAVCAWRENCLKKFSVSGRDVRCPEFVRDVSIRQEGGGKGEEKEAQKKEG